MDETQTIRRNRRRMKSTRGVKEKGMEDGG